MHINEVVMNLKNKRLLVIGGAGLIGSHTVDELIKEDVAEIRIFDNLRIGSYKTNWHFIGGYRRRTGKKKDL